MSRDLSDKEKIAIKEGARKYRYKKRQLLNTLTDADWQECLLYFGNRDAYTGEELIDPVKEHIIPVSKNGDYVRENVVPSNRHINSSKGDNDMIEWYMNQPFYSEYRLQKILNWMGDYSEFLENPKGISFENIKNKSSQYFKITMPDGSQYTRTLRYFKSSNTVERVQILNNVILDHWDDYFRTYWLNDQYKMYNSTEQILERCATFLLMGHFEDKEHGYDIIGDKLKKSIAEYEIPLSSASSDVQDVVGQYSPVDIEEIEDYNEMHMEESRVQTKQRKNAKRKTYKQSMSYRMNQLHSTKKVKTYRLTRIKNRDNIYLYSKDGTSEIKHTLPPYYLADKEGNVEQEKLEKWLNSDVKNAFGQPVFEAVYLTIGGRDGIIDKNNIYQSRWCTVDTENNFCYNNTRYKIGHQAEAYQVGKNNEATMDKILVVPRDGKLVFFDQSVTRMPEEWVQQT